MIDALLKAMAEERGNYDVGGINGKGALWRTEDHVIILWSDDLVVLDTHLERLVLTASLDRLGAVVVPREPTEAMLDAGAMEYCRSDRYFSEPDEIASYLYRAMIAAGETPAIAALRQVDEPTDHGG